MFHWKPEVRFHHRLCTLIVPFWFSMENLWTALTPFWLSRDDFHNSRNPHNPWIQAMNLCYTKVYGDNALLVFIGLELRSFWFSNLCTFLLFIFHLRARQALLLNNYLIMFFWKPEGYYDHTCSTVIAPFRFSNEHCWIVIMPFWLSTDDFLFVLWWNQP